MLDKSKKIGVCRKFGKNWKGPYIIFRKDNDLNYLIKHKDSGRTKLVHINLLKTCFYDNDRANEKLINDHANESSNPNDRSIMRYLNEELNLDMNLINRNSYLPLNEISSMNDSNVSIDHEASLQWDESNDILEEISNTDNAR